MSIKTDLVELGVPVPLAIEYQRQIDAGTGNVNRLLALGLPVLPAKMIVGGFSTSVNANNLTAAGVPPVIAKYLATKINAA